MCSETVNAASGLAKMSLDDFLQEEIPSVSKTDSPVLTRQPISLHWDRGRWSGIRGRQRQYDYVGGRGRGGSWAPSMHTRRWGLRAGVIMTHDPPPRQPLTRKSTLHRPTESVLTVGSHEAPSVKENIGWRSGTEGAGGEVDLEVDLETVLTNALPQHEVNFVFNQKVTLEEGQRCHFLSVKDLSYVKRNTVLKLLVGLLNTGERGVIYMGINEDGRVDGVTAEPQMIGQFVEGIMKTVQFYLMPRLHAPQYGVRYTNVFTTSGQLLNNVWVVELHAVPQIQHYYNPVMDMDYHIRIGKETKTLPFLDFCHSVVSETSKAHELDINKMEEKVKSLRRVLEVKGIDTTAVGPHVCDDCWLNDCPVQCFGSVFNEENDDCHHLKVSTPECSLEESSPQ